MITATIQVTRTRKGQPVPEPQGVEYDDAGRGLPTLLIATGWRKTRADFAEIAGYRVERLPADPGMSGTGFLLHRAKEAVEADPDHQAYYGVWIGTGGEPTRCECRGSQRQEYCKHSWALQYLLKCGAIAEHRPAAPAVPVAAPADGIPY